MDIVDLTFSEIRMYGAGNLQVVRRLRAMVEGISRGLPERRATALQQELDLLERTVEKLYPLPEDLERSRIPDLQGLGGASRVAPDGFASSGSAQ